MEVKTYRSTYLSHLAFYAQSKETVYQLYKNVLVLNKIEVVYLPRYCAPEHWTNRYENDFDPYLGIQK